MIWIPGQQALSQDKQLPIGGFDLKQVLERKVEDMAENHPDHAGMGDNECFFFFPGQWVEKGQDPVREILKTFATWWAIGAKVFPPFDKFFRPAGFDFLKGPAVPFSHMDFIQGLGMDDRRVSGDPTGCLVTALKAA